MRWYDRESILSFRTLLSGRGIKEKEITCIGSEGYIIPVEVFTEAYLYQEFFYEVGIDPIILGENWFIYYEESFGSYCGWNLIMLPTKQAIILSKEKILQDIIRIKDDERIKKEIEMVSISNDEPLKKSYSLGVFDILQERFPSEHMTYQKGLTEGGRHRIKTKSHSVGGDYAKIINNKDGSILDIKDSGSIIKFEVYKRYLLDVTVPDDAIYFFIEKLSEKEIEINGIDKDKLPDHCFSLNGNLYLKSLGRFITKNKINDLDIIKEKEGAFLRKIPDFKDSIYACDNEIFFRKKIKFFDNGAEADMSFKLKESKNGDLFKTHWDEGKVFKFVDGHIKEVGGE